MSIRLRRRLVPVPGGTVVVFVLTILVLFRVERTRATLGWGLGVSLPLWARRSTEEVIVEETDATAKRAEDRGGMLGLVTGAERVTRALERAGSGEGAVGPATAVGDRTVIPLVETYATGGFGGGSGVGADGDSEGSGGGGGGGGLGRSRTVAVADVGPEGVKIRPVVDVTGLALPAITALAALLLGRGRRRRR